MRDEYKITQRGKDYVLFAGLVAAAHEKFLTWSLEADLDKDSLTLDDSKPRVKAFFSGTYLDKDGEEQRITSTGIGTGGRKGDRSGAAADAPIEMAETRAKARALRVAVNVGETAFEELPSEAHADEVAELEAGQAPTPIHRGQAARANPPKKPKTKASEAPAKPDTLRAVRFHADTFAEAKGRDVEEHWTAFIDNLGYPPEDMTEGVAQKWLSTYQKALHKMEEEGE